jgi:hypothetical protein
MIRYIIFSTIWILCTSLFHADKKDETKGVFAVKISLQADGSIYKIMAYCKNGERITNLKYLTKQEFIQYATGNWPGIYNPERTNYLEKYDLNCGFIVDEYTRQQVFGCKPLDSLWKIRFPVYPYHGNMESGWAGTDTGPTEGQMNYIRENYGVNNFDLDVIADTNLYKLLHDVMDSTWIANYKYL